MTAAPWRRTLPKDQEVRVHHFRDYNGRIVATLAHTDLNLADAVYAFAFAPETVEKPIRINSTIIAEARGVRVEQNVYAIKRASAGTRPSIMREVASGRALRWLTFQKKFDDVKTDIKEFARGNPSGDVGRRLAYSGTATKQQLKHLILCLRAEEKRRNEAESMRRRKGFKPPFSAAKMVDSFRSHHVRVVWKLWKQSPDPVQKEKAEAPTNEARA